MKQVAYSRLKEIAGSFDIEKHIPGVAPVTAERILTTVSLSVTNRLWFVLRPDFVSEKTLSDFAAYCLDEVAGKLSDPRAQSVAQKLRDYGAGTATRDELNTLGQTLKDIAPTPAPYSANHAAQAAAEGDITRAAWAVIGASSNQSRTETQMIAELIRLAKAEP